MSNISTVAPSSIFFISFEIKSNVTSSDYTTKKRIFTTFWYQNCKNCKVLMPWPRSIWKKYLWFLPLCYSKWEHLMIRKFSIPNWLSELLMFTIFEKSKKDPQCVEVAIVFWWTCVFTRCFWRIDNHYAKKG